MVARLKRPPYNPVGVSRVVDRPRAPTDREWEQLIAEFRTTFGVRGQATSAGGLRDWSHGNLHIGGISLVTFVANAIRLPRWARERERQMEAIAEHTVKLLSGPQGKAAD